jgi:WD40 repeat protein
MVEGTGETTARGKDGIGRHVGTESFPRRGAPPSGVRFMADRGPVAVAASRSIELWSIDSLSRVGTIEGPDEDGCGGVWAISPRGQSIVWGGPDKDLRVMNFTGTQIGRLQPSRDAIAYLGEESSGLGRSGGVTEADGTYRDLSRRFTAYRTACSLAFSPEGTRLVAAYGQAYALVWDIPTGRLVWCLGHETLNGPPTGIYRVAWSGDARWIATVDNARTLRVWETDTGREVRAMRLREHPGEGIPDRPASPYSTVMFAGGVGPVAFVPGSGRIAVADGPVVRTWDLDSDHESPPWQGHETSHPIFGPYPDAPRIHDLRFSEDGRRALTVGMDATIRAWDVPSGSAVWAIRPNPCCVDWADLSPDGRLVVWAACPGMRLYSLP